MLLKNKRIAIIIPAFNEENTIERVIRSATFFGEAVVIDDCSTDNTNQFAKENQATVLNNSENQGYEKSIAIGLEYAIKNNFNYAITIDADGQHDGEDIGKAIKLLEKGSTLVVGVRDVLPRTGEKIVSFMSKHLLDITDPFCGLKGYRLSVLKNEKLYNFPSIGTELTLRIAKSGVKINQFPIKVTKRAYGQSTFGKNSILVTLKFIGLFLRAVLFNKPIKHNGSDLEDKI
jgi:glycosyltransferase involved in cell wall biosynthesis